MALVVVQSGAGQNRVLLRCENRLCGAFLVRVTGASLSLLGKGNTLSARQGEPLRLSGHCPVCNKHYTVQDIAALLVAKEAQGTA